MGGHALGPHSNQHFSRANQNLKFARLASFRLEEDEGSDVSAGLVLRIAFCFCVLIGRNLALQD